MTDYETYSLWINGIFALLTLIAIILALWGDKIRFWTKPKLRLRLDEPSLTSTVAGVKGWYYLVEVSNDRPAYPARNVRVLLTNVHKRNASGLWLEHKFSGPCHVTWRFPLNTPSFLTVGPAEKATFGHVFEGKPTFDLDLYFYPNNLNRTILPDEPTKLTFKVVADIGESEPLHVELTWDGTWVESSAEMKDHLIVREVTNVY
jgi:hypothetical protein